MAVCHCEYDEEQAQRNDDQADQNLAHDDCSRSWVSACRNHAKQAGRFRPRSARSLIARAAVFGIVAVEPLAHFAARLEKRDAFLVDRDVRAGARIASCTRGTMFDRERTKTA